MWMMERQTVRPSDRQTVRRYDGTTVKGSGLDAGGIDGCSLSLNWVGSWGSRDESVEKRLQIIAWTKRASCKEE